MFIKQYVFFQNQLQWGFLHRVCFMTKITSRKDDYLPGGIIQTTKPHIYWPWVNWAIDCFPQNEVLEQKMSLLKTMVKTVTMPFGKGTAKAKYILLSSVRQADREEHFAVKRIVHELVSIFLSYLCVLFDIFNDSRSKPSYQFLEAHRWGRWLSCFVLVEIFQQAFLIGANYRNWAAMRWEPKLWHD